MFGIMTSILYSLPFLILLISFATLICISIFGIIFNKNKLDISKKTLDIIILNILGLMLNFYIINNLFKIETSSILSVNFYIKILILYIIIGFLFFKNYKLLYSNLLYFNELLSSFLLFINAIANTIYIPQINCYFALLAVIASYINIDYLKFKTIKSNLYWHLLFNYFNIFTLSLSLFYNFSKVLQVV